MAIIKKSDILMKTTVPKKVTIETLGGELWLRPLTSAEVDEIQLIEAEGYGNYETNSKNRMNGKNVAVGETISKGKINVARMQKATVQSKYEAICKSLDNAKNEDDPWEISDIKALSKEAFDELYEKVAELSGINVTEDDVKDFPQDE